MSSSGRNVVALGLATLRALQKELEELEHEEIQTDAACQAYLARVGNSEKLLKDLEEKRARSEEQHLHNFRQEQLLDAAISRALGKEGTLRSLLFDKRKSVAAEEVRLEGALAKDEQELAEFVNCLEIRGRHRIVAKFPAFKAWFEVKAQLREQRHFRMEARRINKERELKAELEEMRVELARLEKQRQGVRPRSDWVLADKGSETVSQVARNERILADGDSTRPEETSFADAPQGAPDDSGFGNMSRFEDPELKEPQDGRVLGSCALLATPGPAAHSMPMPRSGASLTENCTNSVTPKRTGEQTSFSKAPSEAPDDSGTGNLSRFEDPAPEEPQDEHMLQPCALSAAPGPAAYSTPMPRSGTSLMRAYMNSMTPKLTPIMPFKLAAPLPFSPKCPTPVKARGASEPRRTLQPGGGSPFATPDKSLAVRRPSVSEIRPSTGAEQTSEEPKLKEIEPPRPVAQSRNWATGEKPKVDDNDASLKASARAAPTFSGSPPSVKTPPKGRAWQQGRRILEDRLPTMSSPTVQSGGKRKFDSVNYNTLETILEAPAGGAAGGAAAAAMDADIRRSLTNLQIVETPEKRQRGPDCGGGGDKVGNLDGFVDDAPMKPFCQGQGLKLLGGGRDDDDEDEGVDDDDRDNGGQFGGFQYNFAGICGGISAFGDGGSGIGPGFQGFDF